MAEQQNPVISDSEVQRILSTIKQVESSGNYEAKAKGSSASGAYQFINDTWQRSTKRYGIGTEYKTAADAPPDVQDAVAARAVRDILGQVGGDVTKVPLVWYTGNPQGRMTAEALKANQGLTPDKYQQKWMSVFNQGRPATTAQAQAPAQAPRTPVQGTQVAAAAKPSLTDMPPAYRMALAANYIADTESPETSVVERAMEMLNEQQGGAAKNPLAGYMQAMNQESVNPFQFVQQPEEEERRRPVPRMPMRMAEGGPVYGVETNPELSIKNLQTLVSEGQGSESAAPTGPAASGYGVMADIGNSLVGLSESVPGMATAALGMVGQAMVNHALAPFAEALSNEAVATAQANAASAVAHGLASEAEAAGIGPGVGPGIAAPADAAESSESSDAAAASDGPGADGADGDGFKYGGLVNKGVVPRMPKKFQGGGEVSDDEITLRRSTAVLNQQFNRDLEDVRAGRQDLSVLKRYFPNYDVNQIGMMVLPTDSGGPVLIPRDIVPPPSDTRELLFRPDIGRHQQLKGLNELITGIDSPQREDLLRNDEYMARFTNPNIREGDIRFPRDLVHNRGLRLEKGGEVSSEMSDEERSRDRERELRQVESRMSYALGPMDIRAIRKPEGYQARVSSSFNQVVPYMDFDPLTGTFKPTEVGVSYGQMGPEGGYQVRYGQALPRQGQPTPPPQVSGQYRQQLDRNSEIQASGFYAPIPNMRDAYGANVRYVRRFEDGGMANANPADIAEQMTVGTLPEDQKPAGQVFRGIGRDVVRGAQYLPYDLLGAPVDIATMAMRPFGYNVEKPFLGSEYLIDKAAQAGIADRPTGSLAETTSRIGMGFVNPAAVARQIPKGIVTLEKGVEKMTLPAFRQITGNPNATKEEMMDFVLSQKNIMQAGAPAIVKPKGGTFVSGEHSTFDNALEDITSSINREKQNWGYAHDAGDMVKKLETISDFFNTRFKNYYQKRLGSQDDPLRDAFVRGNFNGGDWFNVQELNDIRARIANPQTSSAQKEELLRLLNSKYDAWTDINAIVPERNSIGKKLAYPSSESVNIIQKKLKEQGVNVDKKDISVTAETRDNYLIGDKGLNAINQGDVAYDVGSSPTLSERADLIKDYLMTLNPNQIKNITFEDAIIGAERYHEALKNPAIKFTPQELFEGREKMFNVGDKYQWSEIKTVEALKREGLAMDHCIQGDDYCRQLTSGVGRHFSLQDAKTGIPHTTISTYRSPFAGPESKHVVIGQIKGHSNSIASKYFDQVEKFLAEYEKQVGKIYITEKPKFIPPAFKKAEYTTLPRGYEGNQYAKGGMVDKPLYDRAA